MPMRHTFYSHLAMRGAPARAIQDLAGHQDPTTTQPNMHLSPAAIESAIRLLDQNGTGSASGNIVATAGRTIGNALIQYDVLPEKLVRWWTRTSPVGTA
jgi:hypothetical protein